MESVFFKNMPEATVNRTKRKTKKNKKHTKKNKKTKTLRKLWLRHFPQGFVFCCFFVFVFFCCFLFFFPFKLCKKLSGRTLGRQKDAKSRSWGGRAYIYIYYSIRYYIYIYLIYIYIYILYMHIYMPVNVASGDLGPSFFSLRIRPTPCRSVLVISPR